jgi:hypothetical protein
MLDRLLVVNSRQGRPVDLAAQAIGFFLLASLPEAYEEQTRLLAGL